MRDARIVLSLFGTFERYAHLRGVDLAEVEADPYSALVHAAASWGWNSVYDSAGRSPAPWAMSAASEEWTESARETNVAWFQTYVDASRLWRTPLPLPQLLASALTPARRTGALALTGVQVLAPVHLTGDAGDAVYAVGRAFQAPSPGPAATVRVTIDSGDAQDAVRARSRLVAYLPFLLGRLATRVSLLEGTFPAQEPTPVLPGFGVARSHQTSFEIDIVEWSDQAAVLLATASAEACREANVRCSVLIDIVLTATATSTSTGTADGDGEGGGADDGG
ncbi:hypothetical protein ET495_12480 [Xylanimonas allomyrinae]|uniref:Uncharacterized protein n=1 Tax=Xylanimonas allomyrinae TaxID=2509459 RepID=A0A4P6EMM6_9MICO|nr:hypothetical protein [Xylanimonas allomyrinae]QAY63914.1 hypothetical protein ET495_12480 [Xylanimonas allomyrinae]